MKEYPPIQTLFLSIAWCNAIFHFNNLIFVYCIWQNHSKKRLFHLIIRYKKMWQLSLPVCGIIFVLSSSNMHKNVVLPPSKFYNNNYFQNLVQMIHSRLIILIVQNRCCLLMLSVESYYCSDCFYFYKWQFWQLIYLLKNRLCYVGLMMLISQKIKFIDTLNIILLQSIIHSNSVYTFNLMCYIFP